VVRITLREGSVDLDDEAGFLVAVTDQDGTPHAYTQQAGGRSRVRIPDLVTFGFDAGSSVVVADVASGADREEVLDAYRTLCIPLAVQGAFGQEVVHASGVRIAHRGVVGFCGMSTTGKSTIAHALARRGHQLWADDALAFQPDGESIGTLALPFRPNLRPESERFFRTLGARELDQAAAWSEATVNTLFVLDASSGIEQLERLSAVDALVAVLPNGYRFRPLDDQRERRMVRTYLDLVARVPVFRLGYERGLDGLERLVDRIEETIDSVAQSA
jgi:hypothetical protein